MGNLNSGAGTGTSTNYTANSTVGQTAPGLGVSTNYQGKSGFQYIYPFQNGTPSFFTFSLSQTTINFGTLTPTNPVTRTQILSVNNSVAPGFIVNAYENTPLTTSTGAFIPDTTCDSGTCNESNSGSWTSTLTYGFGYRCDAVIGTICANGFTDSTSYKQFANNALQESSQVVMQGGLSTQVQQAQITYKVNISASQPPGNFSNSIVYIASPTF